MSFGEQHRTWGDDSGHTHCVKNLVQIALPHMVCEINNGFFYMVVYYFTEYWISGFSHMILNLLIGVN